MSQKDLANIAIVVGVGLFTWGFADYSYGAWSEAEQLRIALGAMLTVGGFLWRQ